MIQILFYIYIGHRLMIRDNMVDICSCLLRNMSWLICLCLIFQPKLLFSLNLVHMRGMVIVTINCSYANWSCNENCGIQISCLSEHFFFFSILVQGITLMPKKHLLQTDWTFKKGVAPFYQNYKITWRI